jgi:hypothetical protein
MTMALPTPPPDRLEKVGRHRVAFLADLDADVSRSLRAWLRRYQGLIPRCAALLVGADREQPDNPHVFRLMAYPVVSGLTVSGHWVRRDPSERERFLVATLRAEQLRSAGVLHLVGGQPVLWLDGTWIVGEGVRRLVEADVTRLIEDPTSVGHGPLAHALDGGG